MEQRPTILKANFDGDIRRVALNANNSQDLHKLISELYSLPQGTIAIKYKDDEGDLITLCTDEEFQEALRCTKDNILRLNISKKQEQQGRRCGGWRRWREMQQQKEGDKKEEKGKEEQDSKDQNPQEQQGGRCGGWRRWHGRHHGHGHGHGHHHHGRRHPGHFFQTLGPMIQQLAGGLIANGNLDGILENLLNSDFCKLEHNHICDGCNVAISGTRYHCANCEDFDFCSQCYESKKKDHDPAHQFEEISALSALKEALKSGNISIDAFLAPGKATDAPNKVVHCAICDRCDSKIEGIRWKCFECEDFDFCNNCYLEAAGKEDVRAHKKEHSFGKIEHPSHLPAFVGQRNSFLENKQREEMLSKVQEKEKQEEERLAELEKRKREIDARLEEERKKFQEIQAQLEKERLSLLSQPIEQPVPQPAAFLDLLAPMREQIKQQVEQPALIEKPVQKPVEEPKQVEQPVLIEKPVEKPVEQPKIVYPFEEKLEALNSMGFHDRERNIKLLIQQKGELLPVIQALLDA